MSRVDRTDNPSERPLREARSRTTTTTANRRTDAPGRTPGKAEGEDRDIEEALERQQE